MAGRPHNLSSLSLAFPLCKGGAVYRASHLPHAAKPYSHQATSFSGLWEAREELFKSIKLMIAWIVTAKKLGSKWTPGNKHRTLNLSHSLQK